MRAINILIIAFLISTLIACSREKIVLVERTSTGELRKVPPPPPPTKDVHVPLDYGEFRGCGWSGWHHQDTQDLVCAFENNDGTVRFKNIKVNYSEKVSNMRIIRN